MITLFLHRLLEAFRRHRERRTTIKALSELSDYQLDDLGIERSDIVRLADAFGHGGSRTPAPRVQARRVESDAQSAKRDKPCEASPRPASKRCTGTAIEKFPARY